MSMFNLPLLEADINPKTVDAEGNNCEAEPF